MSHVPPPTVHLSRVRVTDTLAALERIRDRAGDIPDVKLVHDLLTDLRDMGQAGPESEFQTRVARWVSECLGDAALYNQDKRACCLFEEVCELMQAAGLPTSHCIMLLDYVYNRPVGVINQEVGGVMVAMAAFCQAFNVDIGRCAEDELVRVHQRMDEIRQKDANKPANSPLPGSPAATDCR